MGLYFLYILFFILAPLGYGAALAVLLKDLHARQGKSSVEEIAETATDTESEAGESTPEPPPETVEAEPESSPPPEETEPVSEQPEPPSVETPQPEEPEPPPANRPQSVFDDEGLLPKNFKADEILDNMLDEHRPETPEDLSSRMEEPTEDETIPAGYDEDSEDDPLGLDDDFLARIAEYSGGKDGDDEKSGIDFDGEFSDGKKDEEPISSTAREILGDDFDFDSLMPKDRQPETPVHESADGVLQTETEPMTYGPASPELLSEEQEIAPIFPDQMVSEATATPDLSDRSHCFVEESRPMFVRRSPDPNGNRAKRN